MSCFIRCWIPVFVLLVAGCGFGKQAQIESYVDSEKQQLPKIFFADVKVVDMEVGDSEIIYVCANNGLSAAAATAAKDQMLNKASDYVKANKDALKRLIDAQIKMTFVVKRESGEELFRVSVNPWEL